jgi:hypothetical protein
MTVPHQRSHDYAILAKAEVFEETSAGAAANTLRAFRKVWNPIQSAVGLKRSFEEGQGQVSASGELRMSRHGRPVLAALAPRQRRQHA